MISEQVIDLMGVARVDTPCNGCDCLMSRCYAAGPGRKCCPDCRHPQRVQRKRTKGAKLSGGAVVITRPSRLGNPFRIVGCSVVGMPWSDAVEWERGMGAMPDEVTYVETADHRSAVKYAVELYRELLLVRQQGWDPVRFAKWIIDARGRDVACYCPVTEPCHGDPLLAIANTVDVSVIERRTCGGCGRVFSDFGLRSHQSGRYARPQCRAAARAESSSVRRWGEGGQR